MAYERKTSDIHTSEEFRKILNIFKEKSPFAKLLLQRRIPKNLLVDDHINYLDTSHTDPTKISYLTTDRIKLISQSTEDDFWTTSRRYKGKPGALLNKIFKDVPGKEVEDFATLWKTFAVEKSFRFEVVSGEDIRKYYLQDNHHKEWGTLGNSCMKYERCQKYLDIYVDNGIKMLVMFYKNTDEVLGRALLWEDENRTKVMDRIYTIQDDEYLNHFTNWADQNGYSYKQYQNWYSSLSFINKGKPKELKIDIKLEKFNYEYFPYLDTFKFIDIENGTISNYCKDHDSSNIRCLVSPNGGWESAGYLRFDEIDREYLYSGDLIQTTNSSGVEIYTSTDNCNWSTIYNMWILKTDSIWSEDLEDHIFTDDTRNDQNKIESRRSYVESSRLKEEALRAIRNQTIFSGWVSV
jgi:hypothetical protein